MSNDLKDLNEIKDLNKLPKYYNSNFDFSLLSKTELRKILFDHNITPPAYNTLKSELLEFYEINFHKKLKIYRKKYTEALKALRLNKNPTAVDLSFEEEIPVFPVDEHEEISNSFNSFTPLNLTNHTPLNLTNPIENIKQKELRENKEKLINEANHLGSEDIEELEDLIKEIHKEKFEEKSFQKFNEDLITTPEAFRSFSFSNSFNKKDIDPSVGSLTPAFCTPTIRKSNNKFLFKNFLSNSLSRFIKIIILLCFLNEILKNLWCPFCLNTKPFFSEDFLKKISSSKSIKKSIKNISTEFSFCQEKPEFIFLDEETQKFYFKPGFNKNKKFLSMAFRQFSVEDQMTYEVLKGIRKVFFGEFCVFGISRLQQPLKLNVQKSSREVFDVLNSVFKNFYNSNFKYFYNLLNSENLKDSDFSENLKDSDFSENLKDSDFKDLELRMKRFLKTAFLKTAVDLLIDNPRISYSEEEDTFTVKVGWNLFELHFFQILCVYLFLKFFIGIYRKIKEKRTEDSFVRKIVNEIVSQKAMDLGVEELRECYSELDDTLCEKVLRGLNRVKN